MYLNKRLCIVWRSDKSDESLMSLNSSIHQLDSVCVNAVKEKRATQSDQC